MKLMVFDWLATGFEVFIGLAEKSGVGGKCGRKQCEQRLSNTVVTKSSLNRCISITVAEPLLMLLVPTVYFLP